MQTAMVTAETDLIVPFGIFKVSKTIIDFHCEFALFYLLTFTKSSINKLKEIMDE